MESRPLVTIIVPVYNAEKYLARCLDSIVNQTYKNLEIILVDDGSPDNCGKICDEYATRDQRIKVIHKPNGGQSSARNAALEIFKGEYLYFMDSDDYIEDRLIEDNLKILLEEGSDMVAFNYYEIIKGKKLSRDYITNADCSHKYFFLDALVVVWTKVYRANVWKDLRFPTAFKIFEDNFVNPSIVKNAKKISVNPKFYYYYDRSNESSVMTKVGRRTFYIKFLTGLEAVRICDQYFPEFKKEQVARTHKDALRAYNIDLTINNLEQEQKEILLGFLDEHCDETDFLKIKERILLWGYKHCKLINRIKGWHFVKKYKN